jgi:poly(hydroxyalkanoate) depolymerase family esterase
MKRVSLVVCLALVVACGPGLEPTETDEATTTRGESLTAVSSFGSNPGNLNMYRYVPANMPAHAAVVVALHGCTQTAADYTKIGWNELADKYKFYVVYPEQNTSNNSLRCFNWGGEYGDPTNIKRGQGENESIKEMVDQMKTDFSVDASRIFVTGFSGGGAQTALMLAVWPDVFAAGATVAGIPYNCTTTYSEVSGCLKPGKDLTASDWGDRVRAANPNYTGPWPRLAIWQGTADSVVDPNNTTQLLRQ